MKIKATIKNFGHGLYNPLSDAAKLLNYVKNANYTDAEEIVLKNPALIFQTTAFDETSPPTTPLKLSLFLLDTYMWKKIFLAAINENVEWMDQFWLQAHEQQEHVVLDTFFNAYNVYAEIRQGKDSAETKLQAWLAIGMEQRITLPIHMLREFCRHGFEWYATSDFNVDTHPHPGYPTVFTRGKNKKLLPYPTNSGLGFEYTLENGGPQWDQRGNRASISKGPIEDAPREWFFDQAIFQRLYDVRHQDLINQLALAPAHNNPIIKPNN